jgi:hypothetical protein
MKNLEMEGCELDAKKAELEAKRCALDLENNIDLMANYSSSQFLCGKGFAKFVSRPVGEENE